MRYHFEKMVRVRPTALTPYVTVFLLLTFSVTCTENASAQAQVQPTAADVANTRNHINKGNYLLTHQQFQGAISEYEQALATDPSNSVAKANIVLVHNNWGIQYFHQKKYEEARDEWNESLKLSPNDRNAKNNLLVLKTTLAKMPPSAPKTGSSAAGAAPVEAGADTSGAESGAVKIDASSPKSTSRNIDATDQNTATPPGAETAREDNRGVVILSQPSHSNSSSQSNTDAAAMSTSGAAIISSPSGGSSSTTLTNTNGESSPSATTSGTNSNPAATKPNNSIYNNAINANFGNAPSTFSANPLQNSASTSGAGAAMIYPSNNNDFKVNSPPAPAPSPAPTTSAGTANSSASPTFATAPVTSLTSLETTLGEIEIKVYGNTKKDLPIMQRLEKLEQDTNSKVGSGGIADRIQALAKTYGI
jgi:tetratricopeptide (TPR) repeat protein